MLNLFTFNELNARLLCDGNDPDKTDFAVTSLDMEPVYEWKDRKRTDKVIGRKVKVLPLTGGDVIEVALPLANQNGEPITLDGCKVLDRVFFDGLEVRFSQSKGGFDTVVHARATDMLKAGK